MVRHDGRADGAVTEAPRVHWATGDPADATWWDATLVAAPGASVFQSSAWARYRAAATAIARVWVTGVAGGVEAMLLLEASAHPRTALRRLLGGGNAYAWREGPAVLGEGHHGAAAVLAAVAVRARAEGVRCVTHASAPLGGDAHLAAVFAAAGYARCPAATIVLALDADEGAAWRRLRPSARKAVARARRDGVTVRRLAPGEPLDGYLGLLRETRARLGLAMPPHYPTAAMREAFAGTPATCEVFVAEHEGRLAGGLGILGFGETITEIAVAQSAEAVERRLYTSDAIKWEVIRWAGRAGFRRYDLGGVTPDPADDKAAAIRRFKEKWGGALVEFGTYAWERRDLLAHLRRGRARRTAAP